MKFVIQRVSEASVSENGQVLGRIGPGFMVLIGICDTDTRQIADKLIAKMIKLRIFMDENGKTNLDIRSVGGNLLLVSQFTLYADCSHGNRPGFTKAAGPAEASALYDYIVEQCAKQVPVVERGVFGADMKVSLTNEGPFTIMLDSDELFR
jgi:D-tyrosyl-tRNA(Tyr) deacylase